MRRFTFVLMLSLAVLQPAFAQDEGTFIPPYLRFLFGGSGTGGTGIQGSGTAGLIPKFATDTTLGDSPFGVSGNNLDMNTYRIIDLGLPSGNNDAVNLGWLMGSYLPHDSLINDSGVPSEGYAVYEDVNNTLTATTNLQINPALTAGTDLSMDGNEITSMAAGTAATSAVTLGQVQDTLNANERYPALNQLLDPVSSATWTLANKTLTYNFTNPAGGIDYNWQGAASGHLFELSQNTGNPGPGTHLLHMDADDPNVVGAHIEHATDTSTTLWIDGGKTVFEPTDTPNEPLNKDSAVTVGQDDNMGGVEIYGGLYAHGKFTSKQDFSIVGHSDLRAFIDSARLGEFGGGGSTSLITPDSVRLNGAIVYTRGSTPSFWIDDSVSVHLDLYEIGDTLVGDPNYKVAICRFHLSGDVSAANTKSGSYRIVLDSTVALQILSVEIKTWGYRDYNGVNGPGTSVDHSFWGQSVTIGLWTELPYSPNPAGNNAAMSHSVKPVGISGKQLEVFHISSNNGRAFEEWVEVRILQAVASSETVPPVKFVNAD